MLGSLSITKLQMDTDWVSGRLPSGDRKLACHRNAKLGWSFTRMELESFF